MPSTMALLIDPVPSPKTILYGSAVCPRSQPSWGVQIGLAFEYLSIYII